MPGWRGLAPLVSEADLRAIVREDLDSPKEGARQKAVLALLAARGKTHIVDALLRRTYQIRRTEPTWPSTWECAKEWARAELSREARAAPPPP